MDEAFPPLKPRCPSCGEPVRAGAEDECQRCGKPFWRSGPSPQRSGWFTGVVVGLVPSVASFALFEILGRSSGNLTVAIMVVVLITLVGSSAGGWLTASAGDRRSGRVALAMLFGLGYALLAVAVFFVTCASQFKL